VSLKIVKFIELNQAESKVEDDKLQLQTDPLLRPPLIDSKQPITLY